jgi:hypothetical protein
MSEIRNAFADYFEGEEPKNLAQLDTAATV